MSTTIFIINAINNRIILFQPITYMYTCICIQIILNYNTRPLLRKIIVPGWWLPKRLTQRCERELFSKNNANEFCLCCSVVTYLFPLFIPMSKRAGQRFDNFKRFTTIRRLFRIYRYRYTRLKLFRVFLFYFNDPSFHSKHTHFYRVDSSQAERINSCNTQRRY